jgi:hypothetical protein
MARTFTRASSNEITINSPGAFSFSGDFTVAATCKPATVDYTPSFAGIVFQFTTTAGSSDIEIYNNGFAAVVAGGSSITASGASIGTVYRMILSRSGTSVNLYVNGSSVGSTTSSGNFANCTQARIGTRGANMYFNGEISEIAAWSGALDTSERASYTAAFSAEKIRPSSLTFYAPLIRDLLDIKGSTLTNSGTSEATHQRIYQ